MVIELKQVFGIGIALVGTIANIIGQIIGFQIHAGEREALGILKAGYIGLAIYGAIELGLWLAGVSWPLCHAITLLIFFITGISILFIQMFRSPFEVLDKKKTSPILRLMEIVLIFVLIWLLGITSVAGYKYYVKGIEPGMRTH
ncbi:MAG: hypothetical protein EPN25_07205 [Nitrospirae bacterium]|nr:MAG: hypothetical protein EPN25_07205 [Nitrospirota bacterium]